MTDDEHGHLFARAVLAFVTLPGVVGFLIPAWIVFAQRNEAQIHSAGLLPLVVGSASLCWCVVEFYRAGRGTLAPWAPPKDLVTTGPYRWSRNPMYVSVVLILVGWALASSSLTLWLYAAVFAIAAHIRVLVSEEPFLARTHGAQWSAYKSAVRRWL